MKLLGGNAHPGTKERTVVSTVYRVTALKAFQLPPLSWNAVSSIKIIKMG